MEKPRSLFSRPTFVGMWGYLFELYLRNALFSIVTAGIYSFWGKVAIRKYLWASFRLGGDGFTYHGTGKELLKGFAKGMLVLLILNGGMSYVQRHIRSGGPGTGFYILGLGVLYIGFLTLVSLAIVGSWRYRLSRTTWRGITFSFRGKTLDFVILFIQNAILQLMTLGLFAPAAKMRSIGYRVSNSYFGNHAFQFRGRGKELLPDFIVAVLATPCTLGLVWFWYWALVKRYIWSRTRLGHLRFHMSVRGGELLYLSATSWLAIIFTAGIAYPWVVKRRAQFFSERFFIHGNVEEVVFAQGKVEASPTGEGLSELLQIDSDFGFGMG